MKKQRLLFTAAALASVLLSSACSLIYDSESSDISANSFDIDISSAQSISDSSDISSDSIDSSSDDKDSSEAPAEKIPVEFTEEDKEVQKILSDMMDPANVVIGWNGGPNFGNPHYEFRISDDENSLTFPCYLFPGNPPPDPIARPETYAEWKEMMLQYFSAERTEAELPRLVVCTASQNPDGTYTLKNTDGSPLEDFPSCFEADGKLYQMDIVGDAFLHIISDTVKVTSKTEDTIEFTYIEERLWDDTFNISTCLEDITIYSKYAVNGTLKYERGGWKLDSWQ